MFFSLTSSFNWTRFEDKRIDCIAVKPLSLIDSKATFCRTSKRTPSQAVADRNLVSKNYSTVSSKLISQAEAASQNNFEILEKLNCDAVMEGTLPPFEIIAL